MQSHAVNPKNTGNLLMRALIFTLIISSMNANMFNIVLPTISRQFELSSSQVSWIITSYMIVYAVGAVTFGKLTEKYRLKDLLTFGLLLFVLGSIAGLAATEYWMIIAGRVVQAAGASVIPAMAMIVPVRYFSPDKRGRALGMSAIGIALGTAMGPIVAGFVISAWSWRILFVIPLLSLLTLPVYRKYLDDEQGDADPIDWLGGALLAGTVTAILLALTNTSLWLGLSALFMLILFVLRIRFAAAPFISPDIFRNKQYSVILVITFFITGISFSSPYLIPQLLALVNGLPPAYIGIVMLPAAIVTTFLGRKGGKLADEKGNPRLVYTASALLVIGFLCLSVVAGRHAVLVSLSLIFCVLGQSFMQIAMSNTVSRTLSHEQTGVGMGLFSMLTFISAASSTAVLGKVLDSGAPAAALNPIADNHASMVYSNIFAVLAVLVIVVIAVYSVQFGRRGKKAADHLTNGL
ncbi:MFS transporter [Paenibacillus tritici]|uniref:MFS transporter n=1 Tax=Paenibacillus tritici TaxID=1873425 RepID=A0ABX2DPE8_9BACL|nr:MFS transporter [Paenibacillus tritici]NQX46538.1 MFS transporter [Paenibacillus tritici]